MNALRNRAPFLRNRQSPIANRQSAGFTLVEALVAVGLTTIMMWGLLQLYTSATRFSATVSVEAELISAGRAVLERMVREISTATVRQDGHDLDIAGSDLSTISFYAPLGDDGNEVVRVIYNTATDPATGRDTLVRTVDGNSASLGLDVQRFRVTYIDANGNMPSSATFSKSFSSELPMAIHIEILVSDVKNRATIALTSSAFLPGGGF